MSTGSTAFVDAVSDGPQGRRMPVGAEPRPEGGASFRVWAPGHRSAQVVLEDGPTSELAPGSDGYFEGVVAHAGPGTLYRFRLDGGPLLPDPASRFQPSGPLGPSEVVDPDAFRWTDGAWRGVDPDDRVLYELHVGTFTSEGTYTAATERLEELGRLGITLVQLLPLAEFPGAFGWGYDGVLPFAPSHLYGRPEDLHTLVDRAHALGMGVMLDVVYNHLGATDNVLAHFSERYFSNKHDTDWGPALDFDGEGAAAVRELAVENAAYWIREFHVDGYRMDAVDEMRDGSGTHVLEEIVRRARAEASPRRVFLAAETQLRDTDLARAPERSGRGFDALYNEDFHHATVVALTRRAEGDHTDFMGTAQELVSLATRGFLYQGQISSWLEEPLGRPAEDLDADALVTFLENHDQVANSLHGRRLHDVVGPPLARAATAFLLLSPGVPMLFQGQERFASTPFLYFADKDGNDGEVVRRGRAEFLAQYPSLARARVQRRLPDPSDPQTFLRCRPQSAPAERQGTAEALRLHRDLLALRTTDPAFRGARRARVEGAVIHRGAFVLRYDAPGRAPADRRLLLVNFGRDHRLEPAPEPLLAPPPDTSWAEAWSSEWPRYGGSGNPPPVQRRGWWVPGRCALVLRPVAHGPDEEDAPRQHEEDP